MKWAIRCAAIILLSAIQPASDLPAQRQAAQDLIWFSPNVASVDMLELFTSPEKWSSARSRIDVFKFYSGHVGSGGWSCNVNPTGTCGMNYLENFISVQAFSKLGQWGIDIAIESFFAGPIMSVDPVECSTADHVKLWEEDEYDDQTYYNSTMEWVGFVDSVNVELDHSIFQSWVKPYYTTGPGPNEIPINLPEDDPSIYSHTRLINDALDIIVGVATDPSTDLPMNFGLHQNNPNPFSSKTTIEYEIAKSSRVILKIYDVGGREVRTLVSAFQKPGEYSVDFEARDLPTGVYFYKLQIGDRFIGTKKMLLLK